MRLAAGVLISMLVATGCSADSAPPAAPPVAESADQETALSAGARSALDDLSSEYAGRARRASSRLDCALLPELQLLETLLDPREVPSDWTVVEQVVEDSVTAQLGHFCLAWRIADLAPSSYQLELWAAAESAESWATMRSGLLAGEPSVENLTIHEPESGGETFEACFSATDEAGPYCVAAWIDDNVTLVLGIPPGDGAATFDYLGTAGLLADVRADVLTHFPQAIEDFLG